MVKSSVSSRFLTVAIFPAGIYLVNEVSVKEVEESMTILECISQETESKARWRGLW